MWYSEQIEDCRKDQFIEIAWICPNSLFKDFSQILLIVLMDFLKKFFRPIVNLPLGPKKTGLDLFILTFVGYKQTNKQTKKQIKFI